MVQPWRMFGLERADFGEKSQFFLSILFILGLAGVGIVDPELLSSTMTGAFDYVLNTFGWWFILLSFVLTLSMVGFGISKYGQLKIGGEETEPEFDIFSWFSMVFTVGFASAVIFWGVAEPIYIVESPPSPLPVQGPPVESVALAFMFLHNILPGLVAWYLPIALAFGLIVWGDSDYKISSMLKPVLDPDRYGAVYWITDTMALVAIIGGLATSLGFIGSQMSVIVSRVYGVESQFVTYGLFAVLGLIFVGDVWLGLRDGIRNMARITVVLISIVTGMLLIVGPTMFILELGTDAMGVWLDNMWRLMLYTDPVAGSNWPQQWTSFWWAWWAAWGIFVGSFVARVSKGRTIRETIVGLAVGPAIFLVIQHAVLGGWALAPGYKQPITEALNSNGIPAALAEAIAITPFSGVLGILFLLTLSGYLLTSLDSAVFMLSSINLGVEEPNARNRAVWGIVLALLGIMTLELPGAQALESFSAVLALPFTVFFLVIVYATYVTARDTFQQHYPDYRETPSKSPAVSDDD